MKEPCSVTFVMAKIDVTRYTLNLGDNIRKMVLVCAYFLIGGGATASYFYSTQKKTALKTNVVFFFVANSGFEPESPP